MDIPTFGGRGGPCKSAVYDLAPYGIIRPLVDDRAARVRSSCHFAGFSFQVSFDSHTVGWRSPDQTQRVWVPSHQEMKPSLLVGLTLLTFLASCCVS